MSYDLWTWFKKSLVCSRTTQVFRFAVEELLSIPEWVQPPAVQRSLIVDASDEHINPASPRYVQQEI